MNKATYVGIAVIVFAMVLAAMWTAHKIGMNSFDEFEQIKQ